MSKKTRNLMIAILIALGALLIVQSSSRAQSPRMSFQNVIPFVNNIGNVGFFDQSSGTVYLYDENVTQCLLKVQLTKLGEPAQTVKAYEGSVKQEGQYYMDMPVKKP